MVTTPAARDPAAPLPARAEVVVVGAGAAGLACARRLASERIDVLVLEAADAVGGRIRTDVIDGFRCDRGFQLLNPAYPEVRRILDLPALRLRPLPAELVVAHHTGQRRFADLRRTAPGALPGTLSGLARLAASRLAASRSDGRRLPRRELHETVAFARWALHAARADPANLLAEPDEPWGAALDRLGIDGPLRHGVIDQFLSGTLGERSGESSRRFVELLIRSFVRGTPAVPAGGMQEVSEQLAAALPAGALRLGVRVHGVTGGEVRTEGGTVRADAVVVATDPITAAGLTGLPRPRMRPLTTFWHVADEPPTPSGALHVDADRRGLVANSVVLSRSAPEYSPDGRFLVASTVLGADGRSRIEVAVRHQLRTLYGVDTGSWQLLATHPIGPALTAMDPPLRPRLPVDLGDGLLVAGDHRDTASLQGALVSGRRAADAALRRLGRHVPPRPPLDRPEALRAR